MSQSHVVIFGVAYRSDSLTGIDLSVDDLTCRWHLTKKGRKAELAMARRQALANVPTQEPTDSPIDRMVMGVR